MFPINSVLATALRVPRKRKRAAAESLSVDEAVFQQLREAVRGEQTAGEKLSLLEEVQRQLFIELRSPSGAVRLKSLKLIDFLFKRSPVFQSLACRELRILVDHSVFLPGRSHSGMTPSDYVAEVRSYSTKMLEMWDFKHGKQHHTLRAMVRFLRESSGAPMPNVLEQQQSLILLRTRNEALMQWCLLRAMGVSCSLPPPFQQNITEFEHSEKGQKIVSEMRDAKGCLQQLQQCFEVLFPSVVRDNHVYSSLNESTEELEVDEDGSDIATQDTLKMDSLEGSEEGVEWEDGNVFGKDDSDSYDQANITHQNQSQHILHVVKSSMPFGVKINLDLVRETPQVDTGKEEIIKVIKELTSHLRLSVLPGLKRWSCLFTQGNDIGIVGSLPQLLCSSVDSRVVDSARLDEVYERITAACRIGGNRLKQLVVKSEDILNSKYPLLFPSLHDEQNVS